MAAPSAASIRLQTSASHLRWRRRRPASVAGAERLGGRVEAGHEVGGDPPRRPCVDRRQPGDVATETSGTLPAASGAAVAASGREGSPATTRSATASAAPAVATPKRRTPAGKPARPQDEAVGAARGAQDEQRGSCRAHERERAEHRELVRELRRPRRDEQRGEEADRHRVGPSPRPGLGDRARVGDHEEEEDEDLGRRDEQPPEVPAGDRPEVPRGGHLVPRCREDGDPGREGEPEADGDEEEVQPREGSRGRPRRSAPSASASHGDSGPHQNGSGSARSGPSSRKQRTRPKFDGLKTWRVRKVITYFESSATAAVPAKIHHPACSTSRRAPCPARAARRPRRCR